MTNAVPVIDLSQYFVGDQQAKAAVASGIADACEHRIGFFKVVGHGVPQALVDDAFATAVAFFAQPASVKDRFRPATQRLGSRLSCPATKNLAKTLGYDNPRRSARAVLHWPAGQPRRRVRAHPRRRRALRGEYLAADARHLPLGLHAYYAALGIARRLADAHFALSPWEWMSASSTTRSTGISRPFRPTTIPSPQAIRSPTRSARGEHTDFGSLTILAVSEHPAACRSSSRTAPGSM